MNQRGQIASSGARRGFHDARTRRETTREDGASTLANSSSKRNDSDNSAGEGHAAVVSVTALKRTHSML